MRVLVSGMGGELGSLVAARLERAPWVTSIRGLDVDPPRRRLRRAEFHLVEPLDRDRIDGLVREFEPELVCHFGVYEPCARATPAEAAHWTPLVTDAVFAAASASPGLRGVVVRSGIELYGRGGGRPDLPDESAPPAPTTPFGRELADVEARARLLGHERDVPVTLLRLAPVLGPHVPSPLGRLLRLPVVPLDLRGLLACARFTVIDDRDVAEAVVAAAERRVDGPVNVVAPGHSGVRAAMSRGRRIPLPVAGWNWVPTRWGASALGAPIPAHVNELLAKGRLADGAAAADVLGVVPVWSTEQVLDALYDWESVIHVRPTPARGFAVVEGS